MQTFSFPELGCAVHGAAFTAPECPADRVLSGFRAPEDGLIHIGLLHGDVTGSASRYRPLRTADIAASYESDFVVFPELMTLQLLSIENSPLPSVEAVRRLIADHLPDRSLASCKAAS